MLTCELWLPVRQKNSEDDKKYREKIGKMCRNMSSDGRVTARTGQGPEGLTGLGRVTAWKQQYGTFP